MKRHTYIGWFACLFGLSIFAHAQAVPTATRGGALQVGIGGTYAKPVYGNVGIKGPTVYGTFDFTQHIGIEGDIHYASVFTPTDIGENSYLLGPRVVFHKKRFNPYAKVLFGIGSFNTQFDTSPHTTNYFKMYAFGAGVDVRAGHHINVRAFDFEYQKWPSFYPHGLSPVVMTIGAAYRFN